MIGKMKAVVDSVIRLDSREWPDRVTQHLKDACHIPNADKDKARREKIGGWQRMPDYLTLWSFTDYEIRIPRGLAHHLNQFAESYGHKIEWEDKRSFWSTAAVWGDPIDLRDYQTDAVTSILKAEQGYWKSPPGSGKTVAVLEAMRSQGQPSLVIVNTTNIAEQWRERAKSFLGANIGIIGEGKFELKTITIAMQQTLWARREELDEQKFWERWGFVCLDECHHLPAETFTDILSRFPAKYRIGVSGTPTKNFGWKPLLEASLGPMFHETTKKELVDAGWLVQPQVEAYHTGFNYNFFSTHEHLAYKQNKKCLVSFCTRPANKKRHQNNYQDVVTALINDKKRNDIIVRNIVQDVAAGHCVLVLSKRLKHLKELKDAVLSELRHSESKPFGLWSFTGKESTEERMRIATDADKGTCALFSTLADEALDIPRIDRVHLAFPTRNADLIRQQVGRSERPHNFKKNVIVYDYIDKCGPLNNQYRGRVRNVYVEEGWKINEHK